MVDAARTVEDEEQFNVKPSIASPATSFFQYEQGAGPAEDVSPNTGPVQNAGLPEDAGFFSGTRAVSVLGICRRYVPRSVDYGTGHFVPE